MSCLLVLISLLLPRVVMFFIWLLTDWFGRAFEGWILPLLGFFFMPYTMLAYMAAMLNNNQQLSGGWLVLLIVAVIVDVSHWGYGTHDRTLDGHEPLVADRPGVVGRKRAPKVVPMIEGQDREGALVRGTGVQAA